MEFDSGAGDVDSFWAIPEDTVSMDPDAIQSTTSLLIQDPSGRKPYLESQDLGTLPQQWADLPFELSLPSPEYDATVNQASGGQHSQLGLDEYSDASMDASRGPADSTDTSYEDGSLLIEDFLDSPFQEQGVPDSLELLLMEQNPITRDHEDGEINQFGQHSQSTISLSAMGMGNQLGSRLGPQLGSQLGSQLSQLGQMNHMEQMQTQIRGQLGTQMSSQYRHMGNSLGDHLVKQQMAPQITTEIGDQMGNGRLSSLPGDQINGPFRQDSHDPNPQYVRTHPIPPQQRQNWRGFSRRQSISKMPLAQLYQIMGLPHNHSSAKDREERIMSELQKSGFQIGQQTWIRDTEESFRRNVIDRIYQQTKDEYGYSKHLLEAIIRRGTYARMQSNLRRRRRHISRMKRRGSTYD